MTNYERLCKLLCGPPTAYTPGGVAQWKKAGRYGKEPRVGSLMYFYSVSMRRVSHVEAVISAVMRNGLWIVDAIGGNTGAGSNETSFRDGGKCIWKHYEFLPSQVGGTNHINGFGYPVFGADTCSAEQLVEEAKLWVGYLEKRSAKQLEDKTANVGDNNCTIFGRWFGETVGDTATYTCAQWCSMFCMFCAKEAIRKAQDWRTGWILDVDGWTYRKEDGSYCRDEWLFYGGRWYVFDASGKMITGWFKSSEGWYYLAGDGAMCASQWICDDNGKSYYVTRTGLMATSCYVRSDKPFGPGRYIYYWVSEDGVWDPQWDTEKPDLKKYYCAV